jgi:SAM-dependent methyltransferase
MCFGPSEYRGLHIYAPPRTHEDIFEKVAQYIPRGSRVADIGAGAGAFSMRLLDAGYEVTAFDLAPEDFKVNGVMCLRCDLTDEKSLDSLASSFRGYFDAVVSIEVLEHLTDPWRLVSFSKALLRKGGYLFVSTPNILNRLSRVYYLFKGRFYMFEFDYEAYLRGNVAFGGPRTGHINPVSEPELEYIFKHCGFRTIETAPIAKIDFLKEIMNPDARLKTKMFLLGAMLITVPIPMGRLKNSHSYLKIGLLE